MSSTTVVQVVQGGFGRPRLDPSEMSAGGGDEEGDDTDALNVLAAHRAALRPVFEDAEKTWARPGTKLAELERRTAEVTSELANQARLQHEAACAKLRANAAWQQASMESKLKMLRSANSMSTKHEIVVLENEHRKERSRLEDWITTQEVFKLILSDELGESESTCTRLTVKRPDPL